MEKKEIGSKDSMTDTQKKKADVNKARENLYSGLVPFSEEEKDELRQKLLEVEKNRIEVHKAELMAKRAEQAFKNRFVELAAKHGISIGNEVFLPSQSDKDVRLVSAPSEIGAEQTAGKPCSTLHSCYVCDNICCFFWECGSCEQCYNCHNCHGCVECYVTHV